jgi:hypothetical protein
VERNEGQGMPALCEEPGMPMPQSQWMRTLLVQHGRSANETKYVVVCCGDRDWSHVKRKN